jgi:hypothetical protein
MPALLLYLLIILAGLFLLAVLLPLIVHVVILLVILSALIFWLRQLIDVMQRSDDDFPGRNDKLIWAVVIVLGNVFGALAYWIAKPVRAPRSGDSLRQDFRPPDDRQYPI